MRIVTALLTALTLLGVAGTAWAACPGHETTAQQTAEDDPIRFPPETGS